MLLLLRRDFIYKVKGKTRAYVTNDGILKIDSRYDYWEDIMSALALQLNQIDYCLFCGKGLNEDNTVLDYMFPKKYGGVSISNNLYPCCKECVSEKEDLCMEDFWKLKNNKTEEEKEAFRNKAIQKKEDYRYIQGFDLPDYWLSYCHIDKLIIRKYFKDTPINLDKVKGNREYIDKYGHLQRPIIIDKNFLVIDGYRWYLAAKQKQIQNIPVIILENVELINL